MLYEVCPKRIWWFLFLEFLSSPFLRGREFYVELPIAISASGSYHDLGAFISGMAGLPRIVTLHDFVITAKDDDANNLGMSIVAKTYRYKDGEASL